MPARSIIPEILAKLEPYLELLDQQWESQAEGCRTPTLPHDKGQVNVRAITKAVGLRQSQEQHFFKKPELALAINELARIQGPRGINSRELQDAGDTVVADRLLPKEEPEVREVMQRVFEREGVRFVWGRAKSARKDGDDTVVATDREEARGDLLLIASGRKPTVAGLDLEKAGVNYSERGIPVDDQLRTNVKNIYAAGDVTGGYQFTHFAGWQAFQAARNALLPGSNSGLTDLVPWVTFTDPEVAHVGLTEEQARAKFGENVRVCRWEMSRTDRAICEDDRDGFIKVIAKTNGSLLGATVVNGRAGETITEFIVALKQNLNVSDLAGAIHAYPTYSTAVQQLAAELAIERTLAGVSGKIIRGLSKIIR